MFATIENTLCISMVFFCVCNTSFNCSSLRDLSLSHLISLPSNFPRWVCSHCVAKTHSFSCSVLQTRTIKHGEYAFQQCTFSPNGFISVLIVSLHRQKATFLFPLRLLSILLSRMGRLKRGGANSRIHSALKKLHLENQNNF